MESELLAKRRKSLEEEFFAKENARLRAELQARREREAAREALRTAGVTSPALCDRLIDMGIDAEAVAALALVPLVAVAWADGAIQEREREAILHGARDAGLPQDGPAYQLLQGWLTHAPGQHLLDLWADYVRCLSAELDPERRREFRDQLLGRTRKIAEAAGGFLGLFSKISAREQAVLDQLERAFQTT